MKKTNVHRFIQVYCLDMEKLEKTIDYQIFGKSLRTFFFIK